MDEIDSFSSDEEEIEADEETSLDLEGPNGPSSAHKRCHETSSSDSDKEPTPLVTNSLKVVLACPPQNS